MNTKRILFWIGFLVILGLIVWGLIVAMNKSGSSATNGIGTPAPVTSADHIEGPADAPVTLIEYGDFQCPACGAYAPLVEQLFAESSTTMRLVFRHFPLPQHPNAPLAAQAAEAASDQGKFWQMYALLYAGQINWVNLADPSSIFEGYAAQLGLNAAQFVSDMNGTTSKSVVAADQAEGEQIGLDYTPTFFVNGKVITNPQSYADFKALIDQAASGGSN